MLVVMQLEKESKEITNNLTPCIGGLALHNNTARALPGRVLNKKFMITKKAQDTLKKEAMIGELK